MSQAQRIPSIVFQAFTPGTNLPLVNGTVTTYKAGTTGEGNLQDTWSDASQSSLNANPLTLDANGKANIFGGSNAYHIVVLDSDGNTVDDQDYVFFGTPNGTVTVVDGISQVRALPFGGYSEVFTLGYDGPNDNCPSQWVWIPESDHVDDGVLWLSPNSEPDTGRWSRVYNGMIDSRFAGITDNAQDITGRLGLLFNAIGNSQCYFGIQASGQYAFTANYTFPTATNIVVADGAFFSIDTGIQVDMSAMSGLQHGLTTLFSGDGTVTLPVLGVIYAEWFGAIADSSTDNLIPIQKLIASLPSTACTLSFPGTLGYGVSADPGIPGNQFAIYNSSNVFNLDDATVYLARGIHLSGDSTLISGDNMTLAGNLAVAGSLSIGGTFSATSLTATAGDVTSIGGYLVGKMHVGSLVGSPQSYKPGGIYQESRTHVNRNTNGNFPAINIAANTLINDGDIIALDFFLNYTKTTNNGIFRLEYNANVDAGITFTTGISATGYYFPAKIIIERASSTSLMISLYVTADQVYLNRPGSILTGLNLVTTPYSFFFALSGLGASDNADQYYVIARYFPAQ